MSPGAGATRGELAAGAGAGRGLGYGLRGPMSSRMARDYLAFAGQGGCPTMSEHEPPGGMPPGRCGGDWPGSGGFAASYRQRCAELGDLAQSGAIEGLFAQVGRGSTKAKASGGTLRTRRSRAGQEVDFS